MTGRRLSLRIAVSGLALMSVGSLGWFSRTFVAESQAGVNVKTYTYEVVRVYPHDTGAFTEGLVYYNGYLYEGTGLNGRSSLREAELQTGTILRQRNIPREYFGEGIAILGDRIYQLTWKSRTGFIYARESLRSLKEFSYAGEGWGLASDGTHLIMSDGTPNIRFLQPNTLAVVNVIHVDDENGPVDEINELEYVEGEIYANIWKKDTIAIIDPTGGRVTGWVDLSGLLRSQKYEGNVDVLNGIAYDSASDRLFVTGKFWPYVFEIKLKLA